MQEDLLRAVAIIKVYRGKEGGLRKGVAVRPERNGWVGAICRR